MIDQHRYESSLKHVDATLRETRSGLQGTCLTHACRQAWQTGTLVVHFNLCDKENKKKAAGG